MIKNPKPEEEKVIKDIRRFLDKKRTKAIKDRIVTNIKKLLEDRKKENCYKPVRVSNFWSNNYIEYERDRNGDRNKTLSVEEYVNKIRPYLEDIINSLKKCDTWKIQLPIINNFFSSIDNDGEHVIHSKSGNIKIMTND